MKKHVAHLQSPWGLLKITANEHGVEAIGFEKGAKHASRRTKSKVLSDAQKWLTSYSKGKLEDFPPIFLNGTAFQVKVWERLIQIPPGKTKTYGQIAKEIGRPKAARAVGQACHVNPLAILVPCHRVVGRAGLTGYAGGVRIKEKLLEHESHWN